MGLFHCPIGAAYYDDDACIDCGLCNATTSEEKVEASRKIREYIRSHAVKSRRVSKIAVCGKGGVGKSTITVLLARALAEAGYRVVVLDSDDSNPCLARMLGLDSYPRPLGEYFNGKDDAAQSARISIGELPAGYTKSSGGISFMLTGKIYDPFQGCSCSLAESARRIVEKLALGEKEVLLLDTEAGVESFGRGVERDVDTVIAVVEPSYGSIELAARISDMAQGMGISRVGAVLNKVTDEETKARLLQKLAEKGVRVLATVSYNPAMARASFEGEKLLLESCGEEKKVLAELVEKMVAGEAI